jgi:uncharacterized protein (TIGR02996 family)
MLGACRLQYSEADGWVATGNDLRVNGRRARRAQLLVGDRIALAGGFTIRFLHNVTVPTPPAEHRPFLAAIARAPDDDGPRGVFADWLLERSDPIEIARGKLIQYQIALESDLSAELVHQVDELLALHERDWVGELPPLVERWQFRRGFCEPVE